MNISNPTLRCRYCNVLPVTEEESDPDQIRCPQCGHQENLNYAIDRATEHATTQMINQFERDLEKTFRNNPYINVTVNPTRATGTPHFIFC